MDYQPMDQTNQNTSNKTWYVVALVVLVAIFALWYFSGDKAIAPSLDTTESTALDQIQLPPLSEGNTVADISADLSQIPETSMELNADADASVQSVQGF